MNLSDLSNLTLYAHFSNFHVQYHPKPNFKKVNLPYQKKDFVRHLSLYHMLLSLRYHIPVSITTYHFSLPLFICIYQRSSLFQCASATPNNTLSKLCTRLATTKSSSCIAMGYIFDQLQSKRTKN
jgi:hypothetical protein